MTEKKKLYRVEVSTVYYALSEAEDDGTGAVTSKPWGVSEL